ncbi:MAG TPA: RNA polymerase sigma-54 factor, partial [Isosphaeraceae bacterium]|nr:RNA polymerase sigma-54 factor [Isosphaeraceae bacterium]
MRLDTSQQMRTDMRLRMAPRMIQSMEILQLPLMALQERIDQELIENPALEDLRDTAAPPAVDAEEEPTPAPAEEPENTEQFDDWNDTYAEAHRPSRAALSEEADRKHDAMQNMASRPPALHDDLAHQISFLDCDPTIRALAEYIIHNLDERGYLHQDITDVVRDFGGDVTIAQAEEALALVQKLEPAGVGARNARECLLLQLTPDVPMRDVLQVLISNHLEDISQNRLPSIEKKTGLAIDVIKEAIEHLRHLDPRPGLRFAPEHTQYVLPDLLVEPDEHGQYQVRLVDEHTPHLAISRIYQKYLKDKQT